VARWFDMAPSSGLRPVIGEAPHGTDRSSRRGIDAGRLVGNQRSRQTMTSHDPGTARTNFYREANRIARFAYLLRLRFLTNFTLPDGVFLKDPSDPIDHTTNMSVGPARSAAIAAALDRLHHDLGRNVPHHLGQRAGIDLAKEAVELDVLRNR